MIEVNNISKAFEGKVIIDDISAQFRPGICNLIIGTSGSGKTVLTKCIVDLIAADKGKIYFDGEELHSMSKEERKELRNNIGMLFQGNALFDSKTVEENVRFPLDMFTHLSLDEKNKKVSETFSDTASSGPIITQSFFVKKEDERYSIIPLAFSTLISSFSDDKLCIFLYFKLK